MREGSSSTIKGKIVSTSLKKELVNNKWHSLILFCSFMVVIFAWSIIVLGRFYSLQASVFDLGFIMQRLWQPYHALYLSFALYIFFSSGFQFLISPLYFLHSFQSILIIQVFAIEISCFPLYSIAKKKLQSSLFALLISIAFLIYFPSSGILWFDVHLQAFFIPLFIFAYYLYTKNHYWWATLLFILSGTTRFPYMIFPFLFSIFALLEYFLFEEMNSIQALKFKSMLVVLIISTIFIAAGAYFDLVLPQASIIEYNNTPFIFRLLPVFLTIIFILGPLVFIPILRFKWLIMSIPLFALGLYSGNSSYMYPMVLQLQYTSMIVPIVFIGLIEGLETSDPFSIETRASKEKFSSVGFLHILSIIRTRVVKRRKGVLVAILVLLVCGSFFYQPYSPLNETNNLTYSSIRDVSFNLSKYNTMMTMIHLIPTNDPYVLFQNDMPEMLPRPSIDNLPFLFTTYISNNISLGDVIANTFPIIGTNGQVEFSQVNYLIAYTQSPQYYLQFNSKESTLPQILSLMLSSGRYGVLAEDNGFILVERNYTGVPFIYKPLDIHSPFNSTNIAHGTTFHDLSTVRGSSAFVTLVPGNYSVTYYISVTNNSQLAHICGALGYSLGANLSESFNVSASYFKNINVPTAFSFNVTVPNQESYTVFDISASNFIGNITVYNVSLMQTSYSK